MPKLWSHKKVKLDLIGVKSSQKNDVKKDLKAMNNKAELKVTGTYIYNLFDGVQVTVNSEVEEEDLDYIDDVSDDAESMNLDVQNDRNFILAEGGNVSDENASNKSSKLIEHERNADSEDSNAIDLGATSKSLMDEQMVMNNPYLKRLLNKMLDERIQQASSAGETSKSQLLTRMTPPQAADTARKVATGRNGQAIKSPSNTTIYVSVLNKARANDVSAATPFMTGLVNNLEAIQIEENRNVSTKGAVNVNA